MSAPTINSYRRLIPGIIAGYWANWGLDNRISTYRVPGERGAATRIEHRVAGADANPYLAIAASLACGYLGMVENLQPSDPIAGSAHDIVVIRLRHPQPRDEEAVEPPGNLVDTPFKFLRPQVRAR